MAFTPYHFTQYQGPETSVRMWLNDVPIVRRLTPHAEAPTTTVHAVHMLQPGVNTLRVEIDFSPPWSSVVWSLRNDERHEVVLRFEWPKAAEHLPESERTPFRWEDSFEPEGDLFTPIHLSVPPQAFDCHGNAALHDAVRRLHAAVQQGDVDEWAECLSLKFAERRRAYPGNPDVDPGVDRAPIIDFFSRPLQVRPLDLHRLHFESCCDGRVAHVTHVEGGHVIEAIAPDDTERRRLRLDPILTLVDGQWKVLR